MMNLHGMVLWVLGSDIVCMAGVFERPCTMP